MELETALFSGETGSRVSSSSSFSSTRRVNFFDSLVAARVLSFNELTMPVRLFSFLSFSIRLSVCVIDRRSYGY